MNKKLREENVAVRAEKQVKKKIDRKLYVTTSWIYFVSVVVLGYFAFHSNTQNSVFPLKEKCISLFMITEWKSAKAWSDM